MADAYLIRLAEAVKDSLNGAELSINFTAARRYRPLSDLKQLRDVRVTIAPAGVEIRRESRGKDNFDYQVDVAVQQKLAEKDTDVDAQADGLMALVEEITDHLLPLRFDALNARVVGVDNEPAFFPEHWDETRMFTSVLKIGLRVIR